jgi:hypothetical protein
MARKDECAARLIDDLYRFYTLSRATPTMPKKARAEWSNG